MPRPRQTEVNEATRVQIKAIARRLMAEKGTAGLSLRAIAREIGMSAPALYHYFPRLDDLITALIVDAFTSHADHVRAVRDAAAAAGQSANEQLITAALAYRAWALDCPTDFQLIYGNPIPGYVAPAEVTAPAASQMGEVFQEIMLAAHAEGAIHPPDDIQAVPPTVAAHFRQRLGTAANDQAVTFYYIMNTAWVTMYGAVALEVYKHTTPVVGDTNAFYEAQIRHAFRGLGLAV
jgi:AcrR family transcriptional regulator